MTDPEHNSPAGNSENKKTEEVRLKNQLSAIVEFSDDAIIGVSRDIRITSWNAGAENIYGYTAEEVMGQTPDFLLPDNKKDEVYNYLTDVFKGHSIRHFETERLHKTGKIIQISLSVSPLKDEQGNITGAATIGRDITKEKMKEWALLESEEKYRSIFEYSGDGIFLMRERIIDCNQRAVKMLGYEKEELVGKRPEFLSPKNQPDGSVSVREGRRFIAAALRGETPQFLWKHQRKNGELIDTEITLNHVNTSQGGMIIAVLRDISEQIQHHRELEERNIEIRAQNTELRALNKELAETNEKLKQAKLHAEESDRLKSAFLANMSHEIRTPMNGIIGFAQLLRSPKISEEKRDEFVEIIETRSRELLQIINDIIDISMIEANQLQLQSTAMVLNDLMEELYNYHSQILKNHTEKQIECTYQAPLKGDKNLIISDIKRLRQIFTNLLSNAIKFTHSGHITFGYELHQPHELLFFVKDTGIGIPRSAQEKIFERFRQADDSITRSYGGTGLGLSLTIKLVEMLGGQIWVESTPEVGSCFYFTLPYEQPHSNPKSSS